ncbi:class I lanthipeptide [Flavobacterium sp.]|uniref:class I lanthipeptide n=1 Tax=Flavobacterium sp. TaxID=239 RepID=UPI00286E1365|nr:class I lanthipeptide [Flavobacterium sp.]
MKKQNGIDRLVFNKDAVTELNFFQLTQVNGGTSIVGSEDTCTGCCCVSIVIQITGNVIAQI